MKSRLDKYLVSLDSNLTRTKSQDLILNRCVKVNSEIIDAPSFLVSENDQVEISNFENLKYVSRAGLKLEGALAQTNIEVKGKWVLDIGISTGGFSDCLLSKGATQITGVDVGHGQLHEKLLRDTRVKLFEKTNVRELEFNQLFKECSPSKGWEVAVADVSFISLAIVLESVFPILAEGAKMLALVKPQFEVVPEGLNKKGVVKRESDYQVVEQKIKTSSNNIGFKVLQYFQSQIEGKDGNKEFFIYLEK